MPYFIKLIFMSQSDKVNPMSPLKFPPLPDLCGVCICVFASLYTEGLLFALDLKSCEICCMISHIQLDFPVVVGSGP